MKSQFGSQVLVHRLNHEVAIHSFSQTLQDLGFSTDSQVRTIAIKVNLCDYRRADSGATTDPVLLGGLLDVLHERFPNATLAIIENDATTVEIWSMYRLLGIDRVACEHGAVLHNVAEGDWIIKQVPGGIVFQELEVPAILETCDFFINFAKLKTNALTKMTGCLKNVFGLLRAKHKVVLHNRINAVLLDMNKVIKPDLCLVDGYIGQEGIGGPAFGRPKRCELLVGGRDPVAVDACCARIMGFKPLSIGHLKRCHKAGLGCVNYDLRTDIPDFDYRSYKFRFERWEYWVRNLIRRRAGFAT